jgi:hypothetical protein
LNGKKWPWVFIGLYAALTGAKLIWLNAELKEKTGMPQVNDQNVESKTIPPIDAAAPQRFETAAFAMG